MTSSAVSLNEFSGVPVYQPEQNLYWQNLIDNCDPRMRITALAGISAVQAGIENSGGLRGQLLDIAFSEPLLDDFGEVTSPLLRSIQNSGNKWTQVAIPESSVLIAGGIYTIALARRLSRILKAERDSSIPVTAEAPILPALTPTRNHSRHILLDLLTVNHGGGGYRRLKGILTDHDIDELDIDIDDVHYSGTDIRVGSTQVDLAARLNPTSSGEEEELRTYLFASIDVRISDQHSVHAKIESGKILRSGRHVNPFSSFSDLGPYAHYISAYKYR